MLKQTKTNSIFNLQLIWNYWLYELFKICMSSLISFTYKNNYNSRLYGHFKHNLIFFFKTLLHINLSTQPTKLPK